MSRTLVVAAGATIASALGGLSGGAPPASAAPSGTVWLCRPGLPSDPCAAGRAATSVSASGATSAQATRAVTGNSFDCLYVYPTVAQGPRDNTGLKVGPAEIGAAVDQASRFSQVCRVWAPMYRQRTEASEARGLGSDPTADEVAYRSLLSGWEDYLAHDNHGRPVVFIGHSQGAAMLIRLLQQKIDPNPRLRKLMVSAIILGGNVTVPVGKTVGGSFQHISTCTSAHQTGCVIAYSSFGSEPPADADFGRPGQGVSLQSNQTATAGLQVACVNPADFSSQSAPLRPYFVASTAKVTGVDVSTLWETFPGLYTAQCKQDGDAGWLQINAAHTASDPRPVVTASLGPTWGYHLDDANLALGNLVSAVASEEAAYKK